MNGIPEDVKTDLDDVAVIGGVYGWTRVEEKSHARACLERHVLSRRLTPALAASYVVSRGVPEVSAARLRLFLQGILNLAGRGVGIGPAEAGGRRDRALGA